MRGVVFTGDREVEIRTLPDPHPGPGDVVIQMKASGCAAAICATTARQKRSAATPPT